MIKVDDSYAVTIPIGVVRALKLKEKQKVTFEKRGQSIVIEDWEE